MDREEALKLLRGGPEGIAEWNRRRSADERIPDLKGANLYGVDLGGLDLGGPDFGATVIRASGLFRAILSGANLNRVNLNRANLGGARLIRADLGGADLHEVNLNRADLGGASLRGADLGGASLKGADFGGADLTGARLGGADLTGADLSGARLHETDLGGAECSGTKFTNVDLSEVQRLDFVHHLGPSTLGTDTLIRSKGKIPEVFLRGCGLPDVWITNLPALIGALEPIQFHSCFISYSTKDEEFAKRLYTRMVQEGLRVWFAPEDIQGGRKIHEQIDQAIRVYDKLLIVLSPNSMGSEWVKTEVRKAFKLERREGRRKLFPLGLVGYEQLRDWECFDADHGKDLGVEVREYFIPDFSNWKEHDAFEAAFARLLRDLKAEDSVKGTT